MLNKWYYVRKIYNEILDIIYPPINKCIACDEDGFVGLCPCCKAKIKNLKLKEENKISYGVYSGILKKLILEFKYKKNFTAGRVLSNLLIEIIEENNLKADLICYVPMSKKAERKRGFNQCKVIATDIGCETKIPVRNCLVKDRDTKEQKTLSRDDRVLNVKNAFKVRKKYDLFNKNIILIDDVMTTGATVNECEKILKEFGANKIVILTIAKSQI